MASDSSNFRRDPFGSDEVRKVAEAIKQVVADPNMVDSTPYKVARALVSGSIPRTRLERCIDQLCAIRSKGELRSPGAYFTSCMQQLFKEFGLEW